MPSIDTKMLIHGRDEVTHPNTSLNHLFAAHIGGSDNLALGCSPAAEQERRGIRPMVAARLHHSRCAVGGVGNPRCSPKVATDDQQNLLMEPALVEIRD